MAHHTRFDAADYLSSKEHCIEYLAAALEDPNPDVFISALSDVARARGMTHVAEGARLRRASLYKALTPGNKPRYETICKLMDSLGVRLTVVAN